MAFSQALVSRNSALQNGGDQSITFLSSSKLNRTAPSGKSVCSLRPTHTSDWQISLSGIQAVRISAPVAYILLYAALYAAFGVAASPFWPRFFETRALSPQEIGIVLAAAMLTRLLAGPIGWDVCRSSRFVALCSRNLYCIGRRIGRRFIVGALLRVAALHNCDPGRFSCSHDFPG